MKVLQVVGREVMVSRGWRCTWRSDFGDFLGAQTLPRKQSRVLTIVKWLSQGAPFKVAGRKEGTRSQSLAILTFSLDAINMDKNIWTVLHNRTD